MNQAGMFTKRRAIKCNVQVLITRLKPEGSEICRVNSTLFWLYRFSLRFDRRVTYFITLFTGGIYAESNVCGRLFFV